MGYIVLIRIHVNLEVLNLLLVVSIPPTIASMAAISLLFFFLISYQIPKVASSDYPFLAGNCQS